MTAIDYNHRRFTEACGHTCGCRELCPFGETKAERLADQRAEDRAELADRRGRS